MKLLFFTKYTRLGASSRLRTYQYIPYFKEKGITCEYSPLFDDQYLKNLYQKEGFNKINIFKAYLLRLLKLFTLFRYDLVVIEKELFPYLPAFAERLLSLLKIKFIVDYDDAIFHNYDMHSNKVIKTLLKKKIACVMRHSTYVVAGNNYLHDYAVQAGAKNVALIPTVIDTDKYSVKPREKINKYVTIGWIGSPSTLQYLQIVKQVLNELSVQYPIKLVIVGGKSGIGFEGHEEVLEWSEDNEIASIQKFDVGIMPLKDEFWELGKCGYKLIQYMGCGLPVIGSPVGVNKIIIQEGVNGHKPSSQGEWKRALEQLICDNHLRESMGAKGRKIVEANYSLKGGVEEWIRVFNSCELK